MNVVIPTHPTDFSCKQLNSIHANIIATHIFSTILKNGRLTKK